MIFQFEDAASVSSAPSRRINNRGAPRGALALNTVNGRLAVVAIVHEHCSYAFHHRTDGGHRRDKLFLIVWSVYKMLTYNEPALNFYARLRVVRLLEVLSASSFHNSAFRISEVELIGRPGTSLRGFGILAFRLFAGGFLVRTAGFQLALIRGYVCGQALLCKTG